MGTLRGTEALIWWWFEGRYMYQGTDTNISQPLVWLIMLPVRYLYISVKMYGILMFPYLTGVL